ncbi:MAG TPA: IS1595 family transposase [Terriglobales bacterium]|nr:IS1595 family transposase [Terriglobales bacterium]
MEQFHAEFPNDDACLEHVKEQRWPGGVTYCAKCEQERKHHRVRGRTAYACDHCGNHIYPLAGTIFEKSTTSLRLWFYAMYLMGSTRCGISAKQIQRELGVTYKTAWRMFKQIRTLLAEDVSLEGSSVEVDETYVGGVRKYGAGRPMRGDKKKTPVMGLVERGGKVVALALDDVTGATLLGNVRKYVLPKSTVFTDELKGYEGIKHMPQMGYRHRRIKHSAGVYVKGNVHTNTIEGFWSLVKRGIGGVYHAVSKKHLQSYLNEYTFRYNRREMGNLIFGEILKKVSERACESPARRVAGIPVV